MHEFTNNDSDIQAAATILAGGGLVSFPTETVYGLGADATQDKAVQRIYSTKGRPSYNPLIIHVTGVDMAAQYADIPPMARVLMDAFWPGPLTLVLPLKPNAGLADTVTAGLPSVAVRMPSQPVALALLRALGRPIAAPSANPSGRISPTQPEHVRSTLGQKIDALISDGPCSAGLESTIISFDPKPQILRPGTITPDDLQKHIGVIDGPQAKVSSITAPGQMESHYAPRQSLRMNVTQPMDGEVHLGFGAVQGDINLSPHADLPQAAEALFAALHLLDQQGKPIAVAPIPNDGVGIAINDRLRRAAAPR